MQSGYNPYQPQQPAQHSPAYPQGPGQPGFQGPGGVPADGGYNPYAPPTAGYEQPAYGMDMDVQVLAGRGTRLGAALIDGCLLAAAMIPGFILVAVAGGGPSSSSSDGIAMGGAGLLILGVLGLAIYQMYLISTTGQSLAKKWLGIRIVKLDGSLPGFVHGVLLRQWVMGLIGAIPFVGGLIQLVDPLLIFGDERRCLHDHIAGTKVIVA